MDTLNTETQGHVSKDKGSIINKKEPVTAQDEGSVLLDTKLNILDCNKYFLKIKS